MSEIPAKEKVEAMLQSQLDFFKHPEASTPEDIVSSARTVPLLMSWLESYSGDDPREKEIRYKTGLKEMYKRGYDILGIMRDMRTSGYNMSHDEMRACYFARMTQLNDDLVFLRHN